MPPWARQPTTSYWPATTTPEPSCGSNENGVPHLRQNPDVRPGAPSRPRPTGSSQKGQKRRLSGTAAASPSTACAGSRNGTGSISISPAPRCARALARVRPVVARRDEPSVELVRVPSRSGCCVTAGLLAEGAAVAGAGTGVAAGA